MLLTFKTSFPTIKTSGVETFDMQQLDNLDITTDLANIQVIQGKSDQLEVSWVGTIKKQPQPIVDIVEKGDTLTVHIQPKRNRLQLLQFGDSFSSLHVTIKLPKKELATVNIKNDIGSIKVDNSHISEVMLESGVGNISINDTSTAILHVKSDLGTVNIVNTTGELHGKTDIGNIKIITNKIVNNMKLTTELGNIQIEVPVIPDNVSFDHYSELGSIKTFDNKGSLYVPNPMFTVRATTEMGNITVKEK